MNSFNDYRIHGRQLPGEQRGRIIKTYGSGVGATTIAREVGLPVSYVYEILRGAGVEIRPMSESVKLAYAQGRKKPGDNGGCRHRKNKTRNKTKEKERATVSFWAENIRRSTSQLEAERKMSAFMRENNIRLFV